MKDFWRETWAGGKDWRKAGSGRPVEERGVRIYEQ